MYPREVVKAALQVNAAAVIFALPITFHPSGNPEPSRADEAITKRLKDVLALVDVRTLDHIVVGSEELCSLPNGGYCDRWGLPAPFFPFGRMATCLNFDLI